MRGDERDFSSPQTCPQPRFKESSSSVWSTSENSPGCGIKHLNPRVCLVLFMFHFCFVCKGDVFLKCLVSRCFQYRVFDTDLKRHRLEQVKRGENEPGPDAVVAPNAPEPSPPKNLSAAHHARWNFVS